MQALVVGGTGPTGPFLTRGLVQRGYDVSILHRGTHEVPETPPEVKHIHADPHFRDTLDTALAGRSFDLVIATYGRLRTVAEAVWGKTPRFIGVGGSPVYRGLLEPQVNFPTGLPLPTPETAAVAQNEEHGRFARMIAQTEEAVMRGHATGKCNVTFFRYPLVYGPHQVVPTEWCVIRRILDQSPFIILPDSGLMLQTRGYAANLAHAILLAVDQPGVAAGQIYNCGDERLLSLYQWVEIITRTLEYEWDIICMPEAVARPAQPLIPLVGPRHHCILDLTKIRTELGYKDLVPIEDALPKVVRWYVEHQPERGGAIEQSLQDPFDYTAEDQLVAIYTACVQQLQAVPFERGSVYHPYAHPTKPGERDHRQR